MTPENPETQNFESLVPPHCVYHVACMGNWREVIREQFFLLKESGLARALAEIGDSVRVTHLGPGDSLSEVLSEARKQDVPVSVVVSDPNTDHYETLAMLEIERLAKTEQTSRAILYMHTKGVSNPGDYAKVQWRRVMGRYVIKMWRENLAHLSDQGGYDACGFNWWSHGEQHFSGTFWMARADWIRRLPNFVQYHHAKNLVRYSCELWIGAAQWCRAYSHGTSGGVTWAHDFPFHLYADPSPEREMTWISAATPKYASDLSRLQSSAGLLGPEHVFLSAIIPESGRAWRHCEKLLAMRDMLGSVQTKYAFWIDADCEFLCRLSVSDLVEKDSLSAVQHLLYSQPEDGIPERLWPRLAQGSHKSYWQACLWGGEKQAVMAILDEMAWVHSDERGYDEHALNLAFQARLASGEKVKTLPCRYASPSRFDTLPAGSKESYSLRAGGVPRILHHNRESSQ